MKVTLNGREIEFDEDIFTFVTGVMISYADFPQGELSEDFYSYSQNLFNITADIMRGNDAGFNITAPDLAGFPEFLSRKVNGKSVCRYIYEDIGAGTRAQIDKFFSDLNNIFGFNIDPAALGVEPLPAEQPQAQAEVPVEQPVVQAEAPANIMTVDHNGREIGFREGDEAVFLKVTAALSAAGNQLPLGGRRTRFDDYTQAFRELDEALRAGSKERVSAAVNRIDGFQDFLSEQFRGRTICSFIYDNIEGIGTKEEFDGFFNDINRIFGFEIVVPAEQPLPQAVQQAEQPVEPVVPPVVPAENVQGAEAEAPREQKLPEQPKPAVQPRVQPEAEVQQPLAMEGLLKSGKSRRFHMEDHYFDLDKTEDMAHFIALGAAEARIFGGNEKGVFSKSEKNTFRRISDYFFKPQTIVNKKGTPDYASFIDRINALTAEVRELNLSTGRFIKETDFDKLLGEKISGENKLYVTAHLCPEALRSKAIRDYINSAVDNNEIQEKYIRYYLENAGVEDIPENPALLADRFKEVLESRMTPQDQNAAGVQEYKDYLKAEQEHFIQADYPLSDEKKKMAKESLFKDMRNEKTWNNWEFSRESLKQLSNIYDQFNKTKKMVGSNSSKYNDLLAALKRAADFKDPDGETPGGVFEDELLPICEEVARKSMEYLKDKRFKRGTESGEERYDIAFSALALTARGHAKCLAKDHNYVHEIQKVKKVDISDLMERSKFDYEGYKSEKKKKGKIKEPRVVVPKI